MSGWLARSIFARSGWCVGDVSLITRSICIRRFRGYARTHLDYFSRCGDTQCTMEASVHESNPAKKEELFHPDEMRETVSKTAKAELASHEFRAEAVKNDHKPIIAPSRYGFRSFDRQWIIPDARLINRPNPTLWKNYSARQVHLTAPEDRTPTAGPALTLTDLIPDLHHYHGRGGRVFPLWRDHAATLPNIKPALLSHLAKIFAQPVKAEDVMAYLAAVMAHPAFTERFKTDLVQPRVACSLDGGGQVVCRSGRAWLRSDLAALLTASALSMPRPDGLRGRRACRRKARPSSRRQAKSRRCPRRYPTPWTTIRRRGG